MSTHDASTIVPPLQEAKVPTPPGDGQRRRVADRGRIGRELWPAGRLARVLAGILFLAAAIATTISLRYISPSVMLQVVGTFLLAAAAYTILVWTLGERVLTRVDPWLAALALILPLAVVGMLPLVPMPVAVGVDYYVAVSLLVQAVIGYGGCEIAGIPTLLLRRRYTVYCALNGVDVVERWLRSRPRWVAWSLAVLAFVVTAALMGAALMVDGGLGFWIAYVLFLVIGFVANRVVVARRQSARGATPIDRGPRAS